MSGRLRLGWSGRITAERAYCLHAHDKCCRRVFVDEQESVALFLEGHRNASDERLCGLNGILAVR